jgi:serine kinase of HPr protein (carbohydrate metabolism regulator)
VTEAGALLLHGSCVAWPEGAVLLRGPSASGKSDLSLRLLDHGATLVADDQVGLSRQGDRLMARAPDSLKGLLEVRGLGILTLGCQDQAELKLVIDLTDEERVERMPEPLFAEFLGLSLPLVRLSPWPASAADKVRLAVRLASGSIMSVS